MNTTSEIVETPTPLDRWRRLARVVADGGAPDIRAVLTLGVELRLSATTHELGLDAAAIVAADAAVLGLERARRIEFDQPHAWTKALEAEALALDRKAETLRIVGDGPRRAIARFEATLRSLHRSRPRVVDAPSIAEQAPIVFPAQAP